VVFRALREDEIVTTDHLFTLELSVNPAVALFHPGRIPGDVEVEKIGTVVLKVDPLTSGICRDQDPKWIKSGGCVERLLDLVQPPAAGATLVCSDSLFGAICRTQGGFELPAQVSLGLDELREDEKAAILPGSVGIEHVLSNPRDQNLFEPRIGLAASLVSDGTHPIQHRSFVIRGAPAAGASASECRYRSSEIRREFIVRQFGAVVIGVRRVEFLKR
jgi:hypothetical protein